MQLSVIRVLLFIAALLNVLCDGRPALAQTGGGGPASVSAPTFTGAVKATNVGPTQATGGYFDLVDPTSAYDSAFYLKTQPGFPVLTFMPGPLTATNKDFAVDVFPLGTAPASNNLNGVTWLDICNVDLPHNTGAAWVCAHPASYVDGHVLFGTNSGNGGSPGDIYLGDVNNGSVNRILQSGSLDYRGNSGDFQTISGIARGENNTVNSTMGIDEAATNILLYSNTFNNAAWGANDVVAGAANEDPFGGTSAQTVTASGSPYDLIQTVVIPGDANLYTASVFVNAASVCGSTGFVLLVQLTTAGGSVLNTYSATLKCSAGTAVAGFTTANALGVDKFTVGCPVGCASAQQTWWRVWLTFPNAGATSTKALFEMYPNFTAAGSAIIFGAQLEEMPYVTSPILTQGAAVTIPAGLRGLSGYFINGLNVGTANADYLQLNGGAAGSTIATNAGTLEALTGVTDIWDYGVTTAATLTIPTAATLSSATIKMPSLATTANVGDNIVCWKASTGLLTAETTVALCEAASRMDLKNFHGWLNEDDANSRLDVLRPVAYTYKDTKLDGPQERVGLYAEDAAAMDYRCGVYDHQGKLHSWDERCVIAYLVAAQQAQRAEIMDLRKRLP